MTNSQLQNHLNTLDTEALVMFIMNELNVEDFSSYPDALTQLQSEFESSQHAFTPSMADPSQLPGQLSAYSRVTVDLENLSELKLSGPRTLLLVYLGDRPAERRETALQSADATIARVLAKVKTLTRRYSAVLTGKHTTMGGEVGRRSVRSLKAADSDTDTGAFHDFGCIFIYTSAAPVLHVQMEDKTVMVPLGEISSNTSSCDKAPAVQNATLNWDSANSTEVSLTNLALTFSFMPRMSDLKNPDSAHLSSWTMSKVTLEYTDGSGSVVRDLDFSDVYAPRRFSYHCTARKWAVQVNVTDVTAGGSQLTAIELPGFQVQAFLNDRDETKEGKATAFDRAWDCTPFFTIPIWSGLFLSLILLLIFIWSMYMLASVPTMDRFDDPRGQPLHVPTSE